MFLRDKKTKSGVQWNISAFLTTKAHRDVSSLLLKMLLWYSAWGTRMNPLFEIPNADVLKAEAGIFWKTHGFLPHTSSALLHHPHNYHHWRALATLMMLYRVCSSVCLTHSFWHLFQWNDIAFLLCGRIGSNDDDNCRLMEHGWDLLPWINDWWVLGSVASK